MQRQWYPKYSEELVSTLATSVYPHVRRALRSEKSSEWFKYPHKCLLIPIPIITSAKLHCWPYPYFLRQDRRTINPSHTGHVTGSRSDCHWVGTFQNSVRKSKHLSGFGGSWRRKLATTISTTSRTIAAGEITETEGRHVVWQVQTRVCHFKYCPDGFSMVQWTECGVVPSLLCLWSVF